MSEDPLSMPKIVQPLNFSLRLLNNQLPSRRGKSAYPCCLGLVDALKMSMGLSNNVRVNVLTPSPEREIAPVVQLSHRATHPSNPATQLHHSATNPSNPATQLHHRATHPSNSATQLQHNTTHPSNSSAQLPHSDESDEARLMQAGYPFPPTPSASSGNEDVCLLTCLPKVVSVRSLKDTGELFEPVTGDVWASCQTTGDVWASCQDTVENKDRDDMIIDVETVFPHSVSVVDPHLPPHAVKTSSGERRAEVIPSNTRLHPTTQQLSNSRLHPTTQQQWDNAPGQDTVRSRFSTQRCSYGYCETVWDSGESLHRHILSAHNSPELEGQFMCFWARCKQAGKMFKTLDSYDRHVLIHTRARNFPCFFDNCEHRFSSDVSLQNHVLTFHIQHKPWNHAQAHNQKLRNQKLRNQKLLKNPKLTEQSQNQKYRQKKRKEALEQEQALIKEDHQANLRIALESHLNQSQQPSKQPETKDKEVEPKKKDCQPKKKEFEKRKRGSVCEESVGLAGFGKYHVVSRKIRLPKVRQSCSEPGSVNDDIDRRTVRCIEQKLLLLQQSTNTSNPRLIQHSTQCVGYVTDKEGRKRWLLEAKRDRTKTATSDEEKAHKIPVHLSKCSKSVLVQLGLLAATRRSRKQKHAHIRTVGCYKEIKETETCPY